MAGQDPDPVSRYLEHFSRRGRFDAAAWCDSLARLLTGTRLDAEGQAGLESLVETAGCEGSDEDLRQADAAVESFTQEATGRLAGVIAGAPEDAAGETGQLIINTLSFPRTVAVALDDGDAAPASTPGLRGIQDTSTGRQAIVDLPASGYIWLPVSPGPADTDDETAALADELMLRNEFFEVHINPQTGGIERIKGYGRQPNVLSQQLAFRFPRERTVTIGEGETAEETSTWYSEMVGHGVEVLSAGPHVGEIRTHGELVDQSTGERIAGFRQTFRALRYRPNVEVEIELEIDQAPEGDPWSNYLAARFAYGDTTAAITRSVLGSAQPSGNDRFESPYYVEIANESNRVTLAAPGMPFYRKTGDRMLDAILVPEGEQRRKFSMTISVDQAYPMQEALDHLVPPLIRHRVPGPPAAGTQGWFFHLDSRNVQITRVLDLADLPSWTPDDSVDDRSGELDDSGQIETDPNDQDQWSEYDQPTLPDGFGFGVRLQETEGRHRSTTLRCWRTPIMARQRDFEGRTLAELPIEDDGVRVDLTAHEIADIELRFD